MEVSLQLPLNNLSFGQVSICLLQEFHKRGLEPCLFPVNEDISSYSLSKDFIEWIKSCIKKGPRFHNKSIPVFRLWHLNTHAQSSVSDKQTLFSFYELDSPTPTEVNIAKNQHKLIFSSKHSVEAFSGHGVVSHHIPLGFDKNHFKRLDKKYYDDDRIVFNICGKLEKRKRHKKMIRAWAKRFGNDKKYHLQCAIHNPFLKKEMPALLSRVLDGQHYFNIQFLDFMDKNLTYNDFLNSGDIILGMSGAEGWGLPEFHSTAIGKHSVILNASGYKEWASEENSVLVEPSGKIKAADGMFFHEKGEYNQGRIFDFNEDDFINGCEQAIKRLESNKTNEKGLELQKNFTYAKTAEAILNLMKNA